MQTGRRPGHGGRKAKPPADPGGHGLKSQPSSRTGENPPYGMIGGIEETSASFEARSAPRSYPTPLIGNRRRRHSRFAQARLIVGLSSRDRPVSSILVVFNASHSVRARRYRISGAVGMERAWERGGSTARVRARRVQSSGSLPPCEPSATDPRRSAARRAARSPSPPRRPSPV